MVMSDANQNLPTVSNLRAQLSGVSSGISAVGGLLAIVILWPVLHFTGDQTLLLLSVISGFVVCLGLFSFFQTRGWMRGMNAYLEKAHRGEKASREEIHQAFADAIDYPRKLWFYNQACFVVGGITIPVLMMSLFGIMTWFSCVLMMVGVALAGFLSQAIVYISLKMLLAPLRNHLAGLIPDPSRRGKLARHVSMSRQLFTAIMSVSTAMAGYSVYLMHGRSMTTLEEFAVKSQTAIMEELSSRDLAGEDRGEMFAWAESTYAPFGIHFYLLDSSGETLLQGSQDDTILLDELVLLRRSGIDRGNSLPFDSANYFSWQQLETDGSVVLLVTPAKFMGADDVGAAITVFSIIGFAVLLSMGFAALASKDLRESMNRLLNRMNEITSGDLRQHGLVESENELGELDRGLDLMRASLQETVEWILKVSDNSEIVAIDVAASTTEILDGTTHQMERIDQVKSSVGDITERAGEISAAASSLSHDVENSSGAAIQLRTVSANLKDNSVDLSGRAQDASSSIDQMIANLNQIVENTELLAVSIDEVSSSITEMASQVQEVETNAEETARLSMHVITVAEAGRDRVQQSIEGMEIIREATSVAEEAVHHLTERNSAIGSIVDVIDDVADETNLLALNAAIIAAQAGENGKAFSVVADEINELADRVSTHTKEISTLISSLQEENDHAVKVISLGSVSVKKGVELTAEAGSALEEITDAARMSSGHISEIVGAFKEHAQTSQQLVGLMESVRTGVQGIQTAGHEQRKGGILVQGNAVNVDQIAKQVRGTAEEQDRGAAQIAESMTRIREEVNGINDVLQVQNHRCSTVMELLVEMQEQARASETCARDTDEAMEDLLHKFQELRNDVSARFKV